jgi:hypothetical protein
LEGHSKFGNRWTEIAKMVTGRTDNGARRGAAALRACRAPALTPHLQPPSCQEPPRGAREEAGARTARGGCAPGIAWF